MSVKVYVCKTILTYYSSFPALKVLFWPGRPTNALVEFIIFLGGDASGRIKFPHVRTFSEKWIDFSKIFRYLAMFYKFFAFYYYTYIKSKDRNKYWLQEYTGSLITILVFS